MKRLFCLILVILLIALMAVPAFSAIDDFGRYDYVVSVMSLVYNCSYYSTLVDYPYYSILAPLEYDGDYYVIFSKVDYIRSGVPVQIVKVSPTLGNAGPFGSANPVYRSLTVSSSYRVTIETNSDSLYGFYVVDDFSTARLGSVSLVYQRDYLINVISVDARFLENLLEESKNIENIGYTPSSWSVFQNALQSALDLLEQPEYTQEQVDSAYDALLSAKSSLVELPDTTDLESLLAACKTLPSGSYTLSSWSALQSAIQDAEAVLALPEYAESDVDQAYAALESAHDSLVLLPDTSDLESLLMECKSISVDSYTAKSFAALQTAIKQAENLLAQPEYVESDVADAILFLQNAKDNLIELSASDAALRQNLLLFVDVLLANIAVIVPIAIVILGIVACALMLPRILYKFF